MKPGRTGPPLPKIPVKAMEVFEKSSVALWECCNCGHMVLGVKALEICPVCKPHRPSLKSGLRIIETLL